MTSADPHYPVATTRAARWAGAALSLFFLALIVLPLAGRVCGFGKVDPAVEQRVLAPMPVLAGWTLDGLRRFRTGFEQHWNDQFACRSWLVRAQARLMVFGLRTSSSPQVILGRERWLYYAGDGCREDLQSGIRVPEQALALYAQRLNERQAFVASQGGRYLLMVVPDKSSVYPEFLPSWAQTRRTPTRLDQILDYLRVHSSAEILDLREPLRAARDAQRPVYYRGDTHWTMRGAFVAYEAMMERLRTWFPALAALADADVNWRDGETYESDLARLLLLQRELVEPRTAMELRAPPALTITELAPSRAEMAGRGQYVHIVSSNAAAPSLLVFHDSYMNFMKSYLPADFRESRFLWQPAFEDRVIREHRPELVIHEVAERFLPEALRENPPGISAEHVALRAWFDVSPVVLLALTNAAQLATLRPVSQVRLAARGEAMDLVAMGPDPYVLLPPVTLPAQGLPVLRLVLTSATFAECQVFYQVAGATGSRWERRYLAAGENDILLPLTGGQVVGALRLDPAETSGTYTLSRVELRCVEGL